MSRPDRERELRAMLRAPEAGSYNLSGYVSAHRAELELDDLVDVLQSDEVLAPRLLARLDERRQETELSLFRSEAERVRHLEENARWRGEQVVFPPRLLFRLSSGVRGRKYIRFLSRAADVAFVRGSIVQAGVALRAFTDVEAALDVEGLHLAWRGGRGRLNFYPQRMKQPDEALVVHLLRPATQRDMPVLLGEVLAELGFGT